MVQSTLLQFHNIWRSMKKRLLVYMIALGGLLVAALIVGLLSQPAQNSRRGADQIAELPYGGV